MKVGLEYNIILKSKVCKYGDFEKNAMTIMTCGVWRVVWCGVGQWRVSKNIEISELQIMTL